MANNNVIIEKLVAENSRLHKEIQDLRAIGSIEAYTPYRDAGLALDLLKSMGICAKKTDATLIDAVKEAAMFLSDMQRFADQAEKTIRTYKAREDAVNKLAFGQECDDIHKRVNYINQVAKLRATLELVKVRLEQFEKHTHNEEINQLHFDLERFLSTEASK